jgi:hypothetical protein
MTVKKTTKKSAAKKKPPKKELCLQCGRVADHNHRGN